MFGGPARRQGSAAQRRSDGAARTGKTVLLNWFKRACRDRGPEVDVVNLTPADIPTRDALFDVLTPPPGLAELLPRNLAWQRSARSSGRRRRGV